MPGPDYSAAVRPMPFPLSGTALAAGEGMAIFPPKPAASALRLTVSQ
jgi:hypothetical protein